MYAGGGVAYITYQIRKGGLTASFSYLILDSGMIGIKTLFFLKKNGRLRFAFKKFAGPLKISTSATLRYIQKGLDLYIL